MLEQFNSAVAKVKAAYTTVKGWIDYATSFISDEPFDYGSLSLGLGIGLIAGGRVPLGLVALGVGYVLRNKTRVKTLLSGLVSSLVGGEK